MYTNSCKCSYCSFTWNIYNNDFQKKWIFTLEKNCNDKLVFKTVLNFFYMREWCSWIMCMCICILSYWRIAKSTHAIIKGKWHDTTRQDTKWVYFLSIFHLSWAIFGIFYAISIQTAWHAFYSLHYVRSMSIWCAFGANENAKYKQK